MRFFVLGMFIYISINQAYAQVESLDSLVWIRGIVLDEDTKWPIGNVQLASYKTQQLFVADEEGVFRNSFDFNDSIKIFGLGFEAKVIKVKDFAHSDSLVTVVLSRRTYMIRSVDVGPKRKLALHLPSDIKLGQKNETPPAQRNDNFSRKPPVLAAVVSPLSYIHYYASKSEKRKRAFRAEMVKYEQQLKINEFYNKEIIKELTDLEGAGLDSFVVYCNTHLEINEKQNPVVVKQWITELYARYMESENK